MTTAATAMFARDKKVADMIAAMLPPDPEQEKMAKKVAGMTEEQKATLRALLG